MAKRYGNLYSKVIDIDNIKMAHQRAKKDKSLYTAVQRTEANLDERAKCIQKMLSRHTYKVSPYRCSIIEDKKKRVLFKLPYYPDRIIQWSMMLQMEKPFKEVFTDFTCASVPQRGLHYASNLLDKYLNTDPENTQYCLKFDIRKFYPSIDREILKKLLRKKFKDEDLLIEVDKIIDSMSKSNIDKLDIPPEEKYWYTRPGKGIPIGSYLSQYLANYYLAYFDHWLKEELHCKYVIRYMDDIIILDSSKDFLQKAFAEIVKYLRDELALEIKPNWQIFNVDERGIDFVGYRHFRGYKLLRKSTCKLAKQVANEMIEKGKKGQIDERLFGAWVSYEGLLKSCDSQRLYRKYFKDGIIYANVYFILNKSGKKRKPFRGFMVAGNPHLKTKKKYYHSYRKRLVHNRQRRLNNASFRTRTRDAGCCASN